MSGAETQVNEPIHLTDVDVLQEGMPLLREFGIEVDPLKAPDAPGLESENKKRLEELGLTYIDLETEMPRFKAILKQLDPRYQGDRDEALVRYELEADTTEFEPSLEKAIRETAEKYRMLREETPLVGIFAVGIVLPGARRAPEVRALYAAEAVRDERAQIGQLYMPGSDRPLKDKEREAAAGYAPGAEVEYDLSVAAVGATKEKTGIEIIPVHVPLAKASTEHVVDAVLDRPEVDEREPIADITTQIYVEGTQLDIARVLNRRGVTAERHRTAGTPSAANLIASRTTATYLTEDIRNLKAAGRAFEAGGVRMRQPDGTVEAKRLGGITMVYRGDKVYVRDVEGVEKPFESA